MMQYDKYEAKICRIADFHRWMRRHWILLSCILAAVVAIITAFLLLIGCIIGNISCRDIQYGDKLNYSVKTFFSKPSYSFTTRDGAQIEGEPTLPGEYTVHVLSRGLFGRRFTASADFAVTPRLVNMTVKNVITVYGDENPDPLTAVTVSNLVAGDYLAEVSFLWQTLPVDRAPLKPLDYSIRNTAGTDVGFCYNVVVIPGTQTVLKREITLESGSAEKIYDDKPLTAHSWQLVAGTLAEGHTLSLDFTGAQTRAGTSDNGMSATITGRDGEVTLYYDITYNYGKLTVKPRPMTVRTESASKVYDGEPLVQSKWSIISGTVLEGHNAVVDITGSQRDVGSCENRFTVRVMKGADDVTDCYELTLVYGTLTVTPAPLTITTESAQKYYDGKPLTCNRWSIKPERLPDRHTADVIVTGAQTNVGSCDNTAYAIISKDGRDVTRNFELTYVFGTLTVKAHPYTPDPGGDSGTKDDNSDIDTSAPSEDLTTVVSVKTKYRGMLYLKEFSYGDYDGRKWLKAPAYGGENAIAQMVFASAGISYKYPQYTVEINISSKDVEYLLPYYASVSYISGRRYNNSSSRYSVPFVPVSGSPQNIKFGDIDAYYAEEIAYRQFVYSKYLQVPGSTKQSMLSIAAKAGLSATSSTLIDDIANYIKGAAEYNKQFASYPSDADVAVYFLTTAKEGICQHFATAATLMFRAFGIPARYTVGYACKADSDKWVEIDEGHAWVEIYLDGLGWVMVDVTPDGNTGGDGDTPSGGDGDTPSGGGNTPSGGDSDTPSGGGNTPSGGDGDTPSGGGNTPSGGDSDTPSGGGNTPGGGDGDTPGGGGNTPGGGDGDTPGGGDGDTPSGGDGDTSGGGGNTPGGDVSGDDTSKMDNEDTSRDHESSDTTKVFETTNDESSRVDDGTEEGNDTQGQGSWSGDGGDDDHGDTPTTGRDDGSQPNESPRVDYTRLLLIIVIILVLCTLSTVIYRYISKRD